MKFERFVSIAISMLLITSCSANGGADGGLRKQDVGAITGAVVGGFAGSNLGKGKGAILGTIAGTLLGGYIGNEVGASLDRADLSYHNKTSQLSLEKTKTGVTSTWKNPDSGHGGTITPTRTFQVSNGQHCREFTQTITVGGKTTEGYGTACRTPDGSWQIQR